MVGDEERRAASVLLQQSMLFVGEFKKRTGRIISESREHSFPPPWTIPRILNYFTIRKQLSLISLQSAGHRLMLTHRIIWQTSR